MPVTTLTLTLSLHDALPICERAQFTYGGLPLYTYAGDETTGDMRGHGLGGSSFAVSVTGEPLGANPAQFRAGPSTDRVRSAEHTSEHQSRGHLVFRRLPATK